MRNVRILFSSLPHQRGQHVADSSALLSFIRFTCSSYWCMTKRTLVVVAFLLHFENYVLYSESPFRTDLYLSILLPPFLTLVKSSEEFELELIYKPSETPQDNPLEPSNSLYTIESERRAGFFKFKSSLMWLLGWAFIDWLLLFYTAAVKSSLILSLCVDDRFAEEFDRHKFGVSNGSSCSRLC